MKNKIFMRWKNENFPNPQEFIKILNIQEQQEEILDFYNNLKPKVKKIPRIKTEDKLKNNIDIKFHQDFINLYD